MKPIRLKPAICYSPEPENLDDERYTGRCLDMTYKKKFVPEANLRKLLKKTEHPRLDNQESQPKQDFADSSKLLSEIRGLDQQVGDAIKASVPNMG